jgi:hypothetical protein
MVGYVCALGLYVFVSRQLVKDRLSAQMITAIRDRRVRDALLAAPPQAGAG